MIKKTHLYYDDEIDLFFLFKIIWDGKFKILLITIISFLIGCVYSSQIPNSYLGSLNIYPVNNSELFKINYLLKELGDKTDKTNEILLDRFINELNDNEEFLISLKNTKQFVENISKLTTIEDQKTELLKYQSSLRGLKSSEKESEYILNLRWNDPDEIKMIFQDTLNLTMNNFQKLTFDQMLDKIDFAKNVKKNQDLSRKEFLEEQSTLAKMLNIKNNNINFNFLSVNLSELPYYLRGYMAIDKEIEILNEKKIYSDIEFLKRELKHFREIREIDAKWVYYDINTISVKSLKKTQSILIIWTLLGLIVGLFYAFISNALQSKTRYN